MIPDNESDEYTLGFMVGAFTGLCMFVAALIPFSLLQKLPEPYLTVSIIIFAVTLPFWLLRLGRKVSKKLKPYFTRKFFP